PSTQDASIALYQHMSENIVGTEEHVKTIRKMNTVRDNLSNTEYDTTITSGSFGEGLDMRGSDIDLMRVLQFIEVCENINVPINPAKAYFTMNIDDSQPGFIRLRLIHCNNKLEVLKDCEEIGGEFYFSCIRIKRRYLNPFAFIIHGPCISDKNGIYDIAYCLHCKSWITQAQQWLSRSNNAWPDYDVKQSIIEHGVLFVPKGGQESPKEELQWRTSFSIGEKLLVYTFSHTQLLCYVLMKILLKDVIDTDLNCKELLCSYFMKTILFWISEELPTTIWVPAKLISNFMRCVKRLIYCVENSICPHYFITENNLFENQIKGHTQKALLNTLKTLNSCGWQCILFSDLISYFNKSKFRVLKEVNYLNVDSLKLMLSPLMYLTNLSFRIDQSSWTKGVRPILSSKSSLIKSIYSFYMSNMCSDIDHLLIFDGIHDNKSTYKQYKTCTSSLLLGTHNDAVCGWLRLATYFYRNDMYETAIYILQYSLLKCSQEKLYFGTNLSNINYELFHLDLFNRMTIIEKWKLIVMNRLQFNENSLSIPKEIQFEVNVMPITIPPVVYTHFLRFLCHYHLYNINQCQQCLKDLQLTIEEGCFIADASDNAISHNILGITFQLVGDMESAKQAFMKSVELFSDPDFNSVFRRLL
ncbi:Hypothetical predicted protein, partial [Mytilus galloprovincialis]